MPKNYKTEARRLNKTETPKEQKNDKNLIKTI